MDVHEYRLNMGDAGGGRGWGVEVHISRIKDRKINEISNAR